MDQLKRFWAWFDRLPGAFPLKVMVTIIALLVVWSLLKRVLGI